MLARLALLALALLPLPALADVLPPGALDAHERFARSPDVFDRTDAWCEGRRVESACEIPGNAFEGGGKGTCERAVNNSEGTIDLACRRSARVEIERGYPDTHFALDGHLCRSQDVPEIAANLRALRVRCEPAPVAVDRFCAGKAAGASCTATLSVDGVTQTLPGVCRAGTEWRHFYQWGRQTAARPTIDCQPATPTPASTWRPVNPLRRLLR